MCLNAVHKLVQGCCFLPLLKFVFKIVEFDHFGCSFQTHKLLPGAKYVQIQTLKILCCSFFGLVDDSNLIVPGPKFVFKNYSTAM